MDKSISSPEKNSTSSDFDLLPNPSIRVTLRSHPQKTLSTFTSSFSKENLEYKQTMQKLLVVNSGDSLMVFDLEKRITSGESGLIVFLTKDCLLNHCSTPQNLLDNRLHSRSKDFQQAYQNLYVREESSGTGTQLIKQAQVIAFRKVSELVYAITLEVLFLNGMFFLMQLLNSYAEKVDECKGLVLLNDQFLKLKLPNLVLDLTKEPGSKVQPTKQVDSMMSSLAEQMEFEQFQQVKGLAMASLGNLVVAFFAEVNSYLRLSQVMIYSKKVIYFKGRIKEHQLQLFTLTKDEAHLLLLESKDSFKSFRIPLIDFSPKTNNFSSILSDHHVVWLCSDNHLLRFDFPNKSFNCVYSLGNILTPIVSFSRLRISGEAHFLLSTFANQHSMLREEGLAEVARYSVGKSATLNGLKKVDRGKLFFIAIGNAQEISYDQKVKLYCVAPIGNIHAMREKGAATKLMVDYLVEAKNVSLLDLILGIESSNILRYEAFIHLLSYLKDHSEEIKQLLPKLQMIEIDVSKHQLLQAKKYLKFMLLQSKLQNNQNDPQFEALEKLLD